MRRFGRGVFDRSTEAALFNREFDDENGVLGRQRDQHDDADLREDVVVEPGRLQRQHGAEQADGNRGEHGDGDRPALIERDEKEIGKQHRERQNPGGLAGRLLLLQRRAGPFIREAARQIGLRHGFHRGDRLAGGAAGGGLAVDRRRAQIIVANDRRRAGDELDIGDRPQRHQIAGGVAQPHPKNIVGRHAIGGLGLRLHLPDAAVEIEVVDI